MFFCSTITIPCKDIDIYSDNQVWFKQIDICEDVEKELDQHIFPFPFKHLRATATQAQCLSLCMVVPTTAKHIKLQHITTEYRFHNKAVQFHKNVKNNHECRKQRMTFKGNPILVNQLPSNATMQS